MKWPQLRLTVGRMMALVLVLGIATHLGLTAWRVSKSKEIHVHSGVLDQDPAPGWAISLHGRPFWPAYGYALIGRSWKDRLSSGTLCGKSKFPGMLMERCVLANPEINLDLGPNNWSASYTKAQKALFIELSRKKGLDLGLDQDGKIVARTKRGGR